MSFLKLNPHPPSCALAIHVGVTGHRDLPEQTAPAIRQALAAVLAAVDDSVAEIAAEEARLVPGSLPPVRRLISSLAEGADQMMATVALDRGWELQCPLPFPRDEYAKDFSGEAAERFAGLLTRATGVFEHDGDRRQGGSAYLEAGRTMLVQSDLVLAVWDGLPSKGVGGTADIVREARSKGLPVLRIDPAQPEMPVWLGGSAPAGAWTAELRACLRESLALTDRSPKKSLARWRRYLGETERLANYGWLFLGFRNLLADGKLKGGSPKKPYADAVAGWAGEWSQSPGIPAAVTQRIDGGLGEHYAWANGLAEFYAGLFRSAYIARYLLVTASVGFGAVGFYCLPPYNWLGFLLQMLSLVAAVGLILRDNRKQWQRRAVEYRWIAEQLRIHRYLLPLGRTVLPTSQAGHPIYEGPRWGRRLVRNVVRQVGLVSGRSDAAYLRAHRAFVVRNEIEGQRDYHAMTSGRNGRIAARLYRWAMMFFIAGLVAVGLRAGLYGWYPVDAGKMRDGWVLWIKVASAVLPSLGVMFSSLRAHGEFKRIGARSRAMAGYLEKRATVLHAAGDPTWDEAVEDTARLATLLRAEVADWNTVMESRGLALPV